MIHETSREEDVQSLAIAMQCIIDTIERTSIVHELQVWTEAPITPEDLKFTLSSLNNQIPSLQLKDSLT